MDKIEGSTQVTVENLNPQILDPSLSSEIYSLGFTFFGKSDPSKTILRFESLLDASSIKFMLVSAYCF